MDTERRRSNILKWISLAGIIIITNEVQQSLQVEYMDRMKGVKDKIFRNYDRTIRPTNGTNTTEVYTAFIPRQVLELDEDRSIFSLDSYFFMHWYDSRLEWNSSDYDGYLQLPKDLLWVPDINVYNSHSAQVDPTNEVLLLVHFSGTVSWFPPILTQTSCASSNSSVPYPNDVVECIVIVGSWVHDGWEINFMHNMELEWDEFTNTHPRWEVIQSESFVDRKENYYECCPEPYISIHAHFRLKRLPPPQIEATRAPCILTMVLTLTIFWLPADSPKKLLLGGMLFLALNILLIYVAWSTRQPLAVWSGVSFLRTAMYIQVMTLLVQVLVILRVASKRGPTRPPSRIIYLLRGTAGKYLLLGSSEEKQASDQIQLTTAEGRSPEEEWGMVASALDRLFFVITLLVMLVVHHL